MKNKRDDLENLKSLGQAGTGTVYTLDIVTPEVLEVFENKYPNNQYTVEFEQIGEMTTLCPKTGQPDFVEYLKIVYTPYKKCIESKSLKLYLFSYRNYQSFGEDICNEILNDLVNCCDPKDMMVELKMKPRGGISWKPIATYIKK